MQKPAIKYIINDPVIRGSASPTLSQFQDIGQCDCACASIPLQANTIPASAIKTDQKISIPDLCLLFPRLNEYHIVCNPITQLALLNESAFKLWHSFKIPKSIQDTTLLFPRKPATWIDDTVIQMLELGLLQVLPISQSIPLNSESSLLTAWLHITERCNLACEYCYLPQGSRDMSLTTGQSSIDAIFRSATKHQYSMVKLKYAGGEPLLQFPLITKLHNYAQKIARQYNINLNGVILSNGTLLTPQIVETIIALNLRLMISLDGLGKYHDSQRHYPSKDGSFDDVIKGLELVLSFGLTPEISITVSGKNIKGLPELINWLLNHRLPFSINFYRENEQTKSKRYLELETKQIIEGMLNAYQVIEENLPGHNLLGALIDRANLGIPHTHTCAVGKDYLVFNPLGQISKCQMDIANTITDCYDVDPINTIRTSKKGIQNLELTDKEVCRECNWRYWCAGGCPLQTYLKTGHYNTKSPNCDIYKALYPEVLRLEALRLLKYYG